MEEKRICPECGKEYSSRPALSRKDNKTMICPKCGMMEALDTVRDFYAPGMTDQQWKQYKEEYMLKYIKYKGELIWIKVYIMQADVRTEQHMMRSVQRIEPEH